MSRERLGVQSFLYVYDDDGLGGGYARAADSVVCRLARKNTWCRNRELPQIEATILATGSSLSPGYLLHGPPGTGKIRCIGIAAHFGISIYTSTYDSRPFIDASVNQVSPNSVLLFEDIDCMKNE